MSQAMTNTASCRAAQTAACTPPIGPQPGTRSSMVARPHNQHLVDDLGQHRQLARPDRLSIDQERALVAAAEARRAPACQNRG
jgi:hypothetical protein